ncbi:phage tail assembly protein [Cumulibacter manganitolerans]|uniref:phage tail assembly protein n=1 Tax=Cumulibacter manganitolerans TaxID=1884992 RepID=UPI001296F608|nr:phage tail assembly protein [Cumulibacter manganitolerans]
MFRTEYAFTLPMGYVDADGALRRTGTMRLATAGDEILPLRDPRVQKNSAYLVVILLSRVVVELEGVEQITPAVIEGLFAADLAYLQDLYNEINRVDDGNRSVMCPNCRQSFDLEVESLGGSVATPSIS